MTERYTRLTEVSANRYEKGSAVQLRTAVLFRDNTDDSVFVLADYRNNSGRVLKRLSVRLTLRDTAGRELGTQDYHYMDLDVPDGDEWGKQTRIPLTFQEAREFDLDLTEAVYEGHIVQALEPDTIAETGTAEIGPKPDYLLQLERQTQAVREAAEKNAAARDRALAGIEELRPRYEAQLKEEQAAKKRARRAIWIVLAVLCLAVALTAAYLFRDRLFPAGAGQTETESAEAETTVEKTAGTANGIRTDSRYVGQEFTMGEAAVPGFSTPVPIDWTIVAEKDGSVLVVSKYVVALQPFNTPESYGNLWADSYVHSWLNEIFAEEAFTEEERAAIENTTLSDGSENLLFLLNKEELASYLNDDALVTLKNGSNKVFWLLRDATNEEHKAMGVIAQDDGSAAKPVSESIDFYIRPAMWIRLDYAVDRLAAAKG